MEPAMTSPAASLSTHEPAPHESPARIITVCVDQRTFGIDVQKVREIKGWQDTTAIPHAPDHVRGVLNLRGLIIAVYDLRTRIGLGSTEATRGHVIVVVDHGERTVGLLVDSVSDIVDVPQSAIRPAPDNEASEAHLLSGIALLDAVIVGLLDIPAVFESGPAVSLAAA
jgi:purine-binding chemotaxis protein CheW